MRRWDQCVFRLLVFQLQQQRIPEAAAPRSTTKQLPQLATAVCPPVITAAFAAVEASAA